MEYILSYNIIDIPHRQGIENPVTDGLSRMWRNRKRTQNDGSTWSVLPYWEASKRHRKSYRTMSTPRDIFWKPHSKVTYSSLLSWKIYSEKPQVIQLRNDEKQCTGRKVSCLRTINYGALGPKPGVECRRSYTYVTDIFGPDFRQECIECPHCESFGAAKLIDALLQPSNLPECLVCVGIYSCGIAIFSWPWNATDKHLSRYVPLCNTKSSHPT